MSKVTQQGGGRVTRRPRGESLPCPSLPRCPESLHGYHPALLAEGTSSAQTWTGSREARAACPHPGRASASTNVPTAPQSSGHPDMDEFTVPGLGPHKDPHEPLLGLPRQQEGSRSAGTRCPLGPPRDTPPQADSGFCSHLPCGLGCTPSSFPWIASPQNCPASLRGPAQCPQHAHFTPHPGAAPQHPRLQPRLAVSGGSLLSPRSALRAAGYGPAVGPDRATGFESQLCHFTGGVTLANGLNALCLSFLICKMEVMLPQPHGVGVSSLLLLPAFPRASELSKQEAVWVISVVLVPQLCLTFCDLMN